MADKLCLAMTVDMDTANNLVKALLARLKEVEQNYWNERFKRMALEKELEQSKAQKVRRKNNG